MKLGITYNQLCSAVHGLSLTGESEELVQEVLYDTRKISHTEATVFFALNGDFRDGHDFIPTAYAKGVRVFVVAHEPNVTLYPSAAFIRVSDTLHALQDLAAFHRSTFSYPIIAITGSAGKTIVKEWLYHLLCTSLRVGRSPKSYNSQLGVALSLLELHQENDIALIEVGISQPGDMARLERMVQPTIGIFTSFGTAHEQNFSSKKQHLDEKLRLFTGVQKTFFPASISLDSEQIKRIKGRALRPENFRKELELVPFEDKVSWSNALVAIAVAKVIVEDTKLVKSRISSLPQLALRMETFEGTNGNTIINDTYNLDLDALRHSLEFQLQVSGTKKRVVIIGLDTENYALKSDVEQIIRGFSPDSVHILHKDEVIQETFEQAVILIKGTRNTDMQRLARQFRLKKHKTFVEIDLGAIRKNLMVYKSVLSPATKLLAMVKAQSYGSGVEKMAHFLEHQGVHYLGVAYTDEGVELRKQGIQLPILVMNAEEEGFEDCIRYRLEPAIFSFHQLDQFIKELIFHGQVHFPIHLKLDTGMRRLGFDVHEMPRIIEILQAQPEVYIQSVYSHLADADNRRDKRFTEHQIARFNQANQVLKNGLNYGFDRHILNSEGVANFPAAEFEMVRLGIGMYGLSSNPTVQQKLVPALKWNSAISQIKTLKKGESVGYSRTFIATDETKIAVIPVGYADGFRRNLSNGKGGVVINGKFCPTVGRVCMDMIMVDVSKVNAKEGDSVEIIGSKQSIQQFAENMQTIPYEVMTSISKRVHRIYIES